MKKFILLSICSIGSVFFPYIAQASVCICTGTDTIKRPFPEDSTGCSETALSMFMAPSNLPITCSIVECYDNRNCTGEQICNDSNVCVVPPPPATNSSNQDSDEYVQLVNPIGGSEQNKSGITSLEIIMGNLIKAALGIAGSITLVAFVYGAFTWLTSAGKSDKIQEGAQIMLHAAIGLFIIFASYGILNQVIQALTR